MKLFQLIFHHDSTGECMNIKNIVLVILLSAGAFHNVNSMHMLLSPFGKIEDNDSIVKHMALIEQSCEKASRWNFWTAKDKVDTAMDDHNPCIRMTALRGAKTLVEKDLIIELAEEIAELGMQDEDPYVRTAALQVYESLYKQGYAIASTEAAVLKGLQDPILGVRVMALMMYDKFSRTPNRIKNTIKASVDAAKKERAEAVRYKTNLHKKDEWPDLV